MNDKTTLKLSLRCPYDVDDPAVRRLVRARVDACIRDICVLNGKMLRHNREASRKAGSHTAATSFNISSAQKLQVHLAFGWGDEVQVSNVCQVFDTRFTPQVEPIIAYHREFLRAEIVELTNESVRQSLVQKAIGAFVRAGS